ncbi:LON peptidase substrate-binding domain-containing protein [Pseudovibrio exalbescens]|uniref:LON peptidase substrate-binding domain-containing protein n=1 Tax=Pseudovibrio exalbescens TaxID=197461 RepID=UPI002365EF1E|nr:LON peptidase substrate-binding domain-containing protein [Pseudovibrio exalbescens]MDD7909364.1 LON peptidase substrate-binding domain-containing protein [Pseudovibrio exalbescens]
MTVGNATYASIEDVPKVVPLFPLQGALLLPRSHIPLNIFEPRYIAMIDAAMRTDRVIGMIQPDLGIDEEDPNPRPPLCSVGCLGRITSFQESGDGRYLVTLSGVTRFDLLGEVEDRAPFRRGAIDATRFLEDLTPGVGEEDVDRESVLSALQTYLDANELEADWESVNTASTEVLINALSMMSPYGPKEKQALLEADSLKVRADTLIALAEMELARDNPGQGPSIQ